MPVLPIDVVFMQQSSSCRSQVLKKGHTCRCQPVTTVREPSSSQCPSSPKFRSMKSVCFAMLKAEKAGLWQTPQTLCQEDSWLLMLLSDGFQESLRYQETRCLFQSRARMSRALSNFILEEQTLALVQCLASILN